MIRVAAWPAFVCPIHGSLLETFHCASGHDIPVVSGIPRFASDDYAAHFGEQWKRYRLSQLDSYTGLRITENRLRRCLGEQLWASLPGKLVLEAGCGAGRFTEVLLKRGARVVSVDMSSAIEVNAELFPVNDDHLCVQADLTNLPFQSKCFDIVICLGVLQHTPSPGYSIRQLWEHVRDAGSLVIDHYTYSLSWSTRTAPLLRQVIKRLPTDKALKATERLVDIFLPLNRRFAHSPLRPIVYRISPIMTYYVSYPRVNDELQRQWALLDTHDSLTDWYKHFRTAGQIKRTLLKLPRSGEVWCEYGGIGVEARAEKLV